jgi:hypothetical protein
MDSLTTGKKQKVSCPTCCRLISRRNMSRHRMSCKLPGSTLQSETLHTKVKDKTVFCRVATISHPDIIAKGEGRGRMLTPPRAAQQIPEQLVTAIKGAETSSALTDYRSRSSHGHVFTCLPETSVAEGILSRRSSCGSVSDASLSAASISDDGDVAIMVSTGKLAAVTKGLLHHHHDFSLNRLSDYVQEVLPSLSEESIRCLVVGAVTGARLASNMHFLYETTKAARDPRSQKLAEDVNLSLSYWGLGFRSDQIFGDVPSEPRVRVKSTCASPVGIISGNRENSFDLRQHGLVGHDCDQNNMEMATTSENRINECLMGTDIAIDRVLDASKRRSEDTDESRMQYSSCLQLPSSKRTASAAFGSAEQMEAAATLASSGSLSTSCEKMMQGELTTAIDNLLREHSCIQFDDELQQLLSIPTMTQATMFEDRRSTISDSSPQVPPTVNGTDGQVDYPRGDRPGKPNALEFVSIRKSTDVLHDDTPPIAVVDEIATDIASQSVKLVVSNGPTDKLEESTAVSYACLQQQQTQHLTHTNERGSPIQSPRDQTGDNSQVAERDVCGNLTAEEQAISTTKLPGIHPTKKILAVRVTGADYQSAEARRKATTEILVAENSETSDLESDQMVIDAGLPKEDDLAREVGKSASPKIQSPPTRKREQHASSHASKPTVKDSTVGTKKTATMRPGRDRDHIGDTYRRETNLGHPSNRREDNRSQKKDCDSAANTRDYGMKKNKRETAAPPRSGCEHRTSGSPRRQSSSHREERNTSQHNTTKRNEGSTLLLSGSELERYERYLLEHGYKIPRK